MKGKVLGSLVGKRAEALLGIGAVLLLGVSAIVSLAVAPPDAVQGNVQRLMYVHVPAAWLAYVAFLVVFVAS
ncbi:MAG: cytochrome c biogenesis protein CcsA, partial [Actinomycetota bacterium]